MWPTRAGSSAPTAWKISLQASGPSGSTGRTSKPEEITGITIDLIKGLIRDGAQIILPLGGLLIPYVVNPKDLEQATGAPVLNTKAIGINFAEACVRMGMRQSPIAYNPADVTHGDFMESAYIA